MNVAYSPGRRARANHLSRDRSSGQVVQPTRRRQQEPFDVGQPPVRWPGGRPDHDDGHAFAGSDRGGQCTRQRHRRFRRSDPEHAHRDYRRRDRQRAGRPPLSVGDCLGYGAKGHGGLGFSRASAAGPNPTWSAAAKRAYSTSPITPTTEASNDVLVQPAVLPAIAATATSRRSFNS